MSPIIGKKYIVQDNSYTKNISNFRYDLKPSITCACEASNEYADIVTIITEPFKMKPTWICKVDNYDFIIVESRGQFYSTMYYEQGVVKEEEKTGLESLSEDTNIRDIDYK